MKNVVSFPGLGLEFSLDRVAFEVFGRPIYWYGLIIASGLLLATFLCIRLSRRFGFTEDNIVDLLLWAVPISLIAVRAYYVIFNLDTYRRGDGTLDWAAIFRYSDGGLAIYGAIIASLIVLIIYCKVKKISFLAFADLCVHGLLVGQIIGRWGNFMNVEAYGAATKLPWRMCAPSIAGEMLQNGYVDGAGAQAILSGELGVHPTFFYESAWNLIGLLIIYCIGRRRKFDGQCFLFYLFWYGMGRFWIEGLRTDSLYLFNFELFGKPIRVSQAVAAISVIVSLVLFFKLRTRAIKTSAPLFVDKIAAIQKNSDETNSAGYEERPAEKASVTGEDKLPDEKDGTLEEKDDPPKQ